MGILSLEISIGDNKRYYKNKKFSYRKIKKRDRFANFFVSLLIAFILIFLLIFISKKVFISANKISILDSIEKNYKYDYEKFIVNSYAGNIAVVSSDDISIEFSADAGLFVSRKGGKAKFAKSAFERMNPASTTKLMTMLVALKYGNLSDKVKLTQDIIVNEPGSSMANIKVGDVLSLEQLLYGLMLPSGNDAANAIAVHISGSIEEFAKLMTSEAKKIYAIDSNFVNANGLTDESHYTTAYDLYLIINELLKYEEFRKITTTIAYEPLYKLANGEDFINHWDNGNKFVSGNVSLPLNLEVIGGKTGTTKAAGYCLVLATKDIFTGEEFISIVLKSENKDSLYKNMYNLLEKLS